MKNKFAKISSVSFAFMLVISIVSFAFILGGVASDPLDVYSSERFLSQSTLDTTTKGTVAPFPFVPVFGRSNSLTGQIAGPARQEYEITPLKVSVGNENKDIGRVYKEGGKFFSSVGGYDITSQMNEKGYISEGNINQQFLKSSYGQINYMKVDNELVQVRTRTYQTPEGETTILEASPGNNDWTEITYDGESQSLYALPDGYTYDSKTKTFSGGLGEVISTKGEYSYVNIDNKIYKQGSDTILREVELSNKLPSGTVPVEFDAAGNPTKWKSPEGAIFDNKGEFLERGKVKVFGQEFNFAIGHILQGVQWAGTAAGLVITLGGIFSKDQQKVNAAAAGIAAGIMVGKVSYGLLGGGGVNNFLERRTTWGEVLSHPAFSAALGAAAAWMVYNSMWSKKTTSEEIVVFECKPWQAPYGGKDCELCNQGTLPCSEYRCKSLGQSCGIVNKGTESERCTNLHINDAKPPVITPDKKELSERFEYYEVRPSPPGAGFKIKSMEGNTGCIPAFTPLKFGIVTDELSQCKIDVVPGKTYEEMAMYIGGDSLFKYNHVETLSLPTLNDLKESAVTIKNGKNLEFYIKCTDPNGNYNPADYSMSFCVDPSPDTTPPIVYGTSVIDGGCVAYETENATVEFYINEPAECKWDTRDKPFEQMLNKMSCSDSVAEINAIQAYTCTSTLNGINRDGTNFYVRCIDQPGLEDYNKRNQMTKGERFTLRRGSQLLLKDANPNNETIFGIVRPLPIELKVDTFGGCDDNTAACYYSTSKSSEGFIQFFETNTHDGVSTQPLNLDSGNYKYYIKCFDSGGNLAETEINFKVEIDQSTPIIARAYYEDLDDSLKLVTTTESECVYSTVDCNYLFSSEGTPFRSYDKRVHYADWLPDKKYFVKCRDEYRPDPVDCSLIINPKEGFLDD